MMENYTFDAFISYSHKDMDWAKWLQKRLETFHIPKEAAKERGPGKLRVFRDQTDLAGVELNEALNNNLRSSQYLIVICSPNSASSIWVNAEVLEFHRMGRTKFIIPFIVDGEPESDDPELECFPEGLRNLPDDQHMLGANVQEIGKTKAFLKVVSIILQIRFNRLVDREKQRKRWMYLTVSCIASVVLGLLIYNIWISEKNHRLAYGAYMSAMNEAYNSGSDEDFRAAMKNVDISALEASANEDNTDAMALLASCYAYGYGTEINNEKAFEWFEKAAESGDCQALCALGSCYLDGTGTPKNPEKAFECFMKSTEQDYPEGYYLVGLAYLEGVGVEKNDEKSFEYIKKAAEKKHDNALMQLALYYRDGIGCEQSPEKAYEANLELAEKGNTTGIYNVAMMKQFGWGTEEDMEGAYDYYRKGAFLGDSACMYQVGMCTLENIGTTDAALEWFEDAKEAATEEGNEKLLETIEKAIEKENTASK